MEGKHFCWGMVKNFHRYINLWKKTQKQQKIKTLRHNLCDAVKNVNFDFSLNKKGFFRLSEISNFSSGSHFNLLRKNLIQFLHLFSVFHRRLHPFDNILWQCVNMYRDAVHCQTSSEPIRRKANEWRRRWKRWEICLFCALIWWCRCWNHNLLGKDFSAFYPISIVCSPDGSTRKRNPC